MLPALLSDFFHLPAIDIGALARMCKNSCRRTWLQVHEAIFTAGRKQCHLCRINYWITSKELKVITWCKF